MGPQGDSIPQRRCNSCNKNQENQRTEGKLKPHITVEPNQNEKM